MVSEQVGNALSTGPYKEEMAETARFVKMFDKYVHDCLSTECIYNGNYASSLIA